MADSETRVITQADGDTFDVTHRGVVTVQGYEKGDALKHRVAGEMVHSTTSDRPLVHMVLWDEDCACEVNGRVTVVGDAAAPIAVAMRHSFVDEHRQSHVVKTALADPIHHALQLRTPLQVRFCNTWHLASDYTLEISLGNCQVIGVRLTGATVAIPRPCDDEVPCAPIISKPIHP